jgi:hypothetical protein
MKLVKIRGVFVSLMRIYVRAYSMQSACTSGDAIPSARDEDVQVSVTPV